MIKSRDQLKQLFSNGSMPNGESFANLIDSMGQEVELSTIGMQLTQLQAAQTSSQQALQDLKNQVQQLSPPPAPAPSTVALDSPEWVAAGGRFGRFDASKPIPSGSSLATLSVAADGDWHPLLNIDSSCVAFEVVASVMGNGKSQAITHGIVVSTAFGHGLCSIRQTRAYNGWSFWNRISFRWKAQQLQVKTHSKYRLTNGSCPFIQYAITRLW
ncbi:hypothetical protein ACO0LB_17150 [Undibacterium sp. SXout7W]|uniref:hypothetical protein n=1 Tax=Undibacterium sp. SXout7W TaxID=3413049 RepID=UPI003BF25E25